MPALTYRQYMAAEMASLSREYPDADPADLQDMVSGPSRRQDWIDGLIPALLEDIPGPQAWRAICAEVGRDFIMRRLFHDNPGTDARYLAAGRIVPADIR